MKNLGLSNDAIKRVKKAQNGTYFSLYIQKRICVQSIKRAAMVQEEKDNRTFYNEQKISTDTS